MAENIASAFSLEDNIQLVEDVVTEPLNYKKLCEFLDGKGKHQHIFFFYQPPDRGAAAKDDHVKSGSVAAVSRLTLTTGEHERIKDSAVYFLRNVSPADKSIRQDVPADQDLLFGEVTANPLESFSASLADIFQPLVASTGSVKCAGAWGRCDEEHENDFLQGLDKFVREVTEAIRAMTGGILLNTDGLTRVDFETQSDQIREDPDIVVQYGARLEQWCKEIEQYLEDSLDQTEKVSEPGPRTELEFWRGRVQRITSITEQLKSQGCKMVFNVLHSVTRTPGINGDVAPKSRQTLFNSLRRWKQIEISITEAFNEAKDNVKYLTTLEKFIEPLYTGSPTHIIDTLPALLNSVKMIHTIARYYNTSERMTNLFAKITNQMITNCKLCILDGEEEADALWEKHALQLIHNLEACLLLNEAYRKQYHLTRERLLTLPKGKQFDFSETLIFGRFDLFCRRVVKLIDMFSTIHQFKLLSVHLKSMDGIHQLVGAFRANIDDFRVKRHDLLDFLNNRFDRDYVEFNVRISDLEGALQEFINQSFTSITSVGTSLKLLGKFQRILQHGSLRADLESKLWVIFHNYGLELNVVSDLYEKLKGSPPLARNAPPVAGNILWARHLLRRISDPMHQFQTCAQSLTATKDTKKITRAFNKMAKTLVEFEIVWYQAWVTSIEAARSGLQATLLVKHPEDGRHHVNLDPEVLQLIRETRCLDRMGQVEIPDAAKMILLQEEKIKVYSSELIFMLREYRRVTLLVRPITANILKPHLDDMELCLRPGMSTLTWTSMNIDGYITNAWDCIRRLEQLVTTVNDIMDNRIDANLKFVSWVLLVNLPDDGQLVSLESFVDIQERHVREMTTWLITKNGEIESAVDDILFAIASYSLDPHIRGISESEIIKVKAHYNWGMYQALLKATKRSLDAMKSRIVARRRKGGASHSPFFKVDLQLNGLGVCLKPSIDDIQSAVNGGAVAVLKCSKVIEAWDTVTIPRGVQLILNPNLPPVRGTGAQGTFYDRIAQDKEILKVVLLLTGSIQTSRNECGRYLHQFDHLDWLWSGDIDEQYEQFTAESPSLDEFESKLRSFAKLEREVDELEGRRQICALMLETETLVQNLKVLASKWKESFARELHVQAFHKLESLSNIIKTTAKNMNREVGEGDIDALGSVMQTLHEVRQKQGEIEMEFEPLTHMYAILDAYLPNILDKEEQDARSLLRSSWDRLLKESEVRQEELTLKQARFKRTLIMTVNAFKKDVGKFRRDYEEHGPMVVGIPPMHAVERLKRCREEYEVHGRKQEIFQVGEDLFGLPRQQYGALDKTKKELEYLEQLYELYTAVLETIKGWKEYLWIEVPNHMERMKDQVDKFALRCKKMPKQLRQWPAYNELKKEIEDFKEALPLLMELSKMSIQQRHWQAVNALTGKDLQIDREDFRLQSLIDAKLNEYKDDILEICDSADKQLLIEEKIHDISKDWEQRTFEFACWKSREVPCILVSSKVTEVQEALEETQMALNAMNAQRHSAPFKSELVMMLTIYSDTSDTMERWFKVQQMWTSLESVFTGGDIAKQMPMEAKKFSQIDKDWVKIMQKSSETRLVVECCQNDLLRQMLVPFSAGLEMCQKSLESYLEGKRHKFPRFYFTSNPVLLKILSQGSDPESIQDDFEKLFDSIGRVTFHKADHKKIVKIKSVAGTVEEVVDLQTPVLAQGNIEDWLLCLEAEMQRSVRRECRLCSSDVSAVMAETTVQNFADKFIAQVALLGMQLIWTTDFQQALMMVSRDKDRTIMSSTAKKFNLLLNDIIAVCLQPLTQLDRTKYETLVTIHVHQRDLFQEVQRKVKEQKVRDENDFEWLKQTRIYWKTETDQAVISIADNDFVYSYEYLGCKERLVITALTDRCYLTQSQALGMFFGGAPAGPAGTGKTETTKDMGRTLGIFVVVTNCSDQHRFKDMAKIFKGLCMSGLWGCFDEFNRIELEVLSVVAMQVEAIMQGRKQNAKTFTFPGEPAPIKLVQSVGYFITMNPGYAGRQALPENLKVLFRSVSMMVPNRETIMKVKLASAGFSGSASDVLGRKFNILYALCEQQLSKQRHYDFGLRNILSVLRQSGAVKRAEKEDTDEEMLFMRAVRDMNLSKLVADDVQLFLALLKDLFPKVVDPPKKTYPDLERMTQRLVTSTKLVEKDTWMLKVIQLYETSLVRHGFMLVGPTLCGKTQIMSILTRAMAEGANPNPHRIVAMNPKAITDSQMYGVKDAADEWTPGVFSMIWQQRNNRALKYTTWIVCDGPIDAVWIENLNTVLDDNKILTLANNDRIPMTDNCRIVFEVEDLRNASPATVSRAGIIYVSSSDLGWEPFVESWLMQRVGMGAVRALEVEVLRPVFQQWLSQPPPGGGHATSFFDWNRRHLKKVMEINDTTMIVNVLNLLSASLLPHVDNNEAPTEGACLRLLAYSVAWGIGGLLEAGDRLVFNNKLMEVFARDGHHDAIPPCAEDETIFEYVPTWQERGRQWQLWAPQEWKPPRRLVFSALLIPTVDSVRAEYMVDIVANLEQTTNPPNYRSSLIVGAAGTAKTSTAMMYLQKFSLDTMLAKRVNFSSATTPLNLQRTIELEVERKTGKTFCPPGGKRLTVFLDDASMPLVNKWGDQITNELTRQLVETGGFYFLDREKRGEFKKIENLQYLCGMGHPGGGRNDVPGRLKSKFLAFNMTLPSQVSVDNIYGSILKAQFNPKLVSDAAVIALTKRLNAVTIAVWLKVQKSLPPTPARFHYIFNMRELSHVFQGIMETPVSVIIDEQTLVGLWRHECTRVFGDKLARQQDKELLDRIVSDFALEHFGDGLAGRSPTQRSQWWCDFQRDQKPASDDGDGETPKVYEPVVSWERVRSKAYEYLALLNEKSPAKAMNLVLFDDAMMHLMRINRTIQQRRGSAMLVGVGGSGKQSLTRLAGFISNHYLFQIAISKTYNDIAFMEDLRDLYIRAGQKGDQVTFILTDAEVKTESFLEYMNSMLATGEVVGLMQKEDKDAACAEVRNDYVKDFPSAEENMVNMYAYFLDKLRDNLHVVICFSPLHPRFALRAQMFPALFNAVNINWFLPWPEQALVAVSQSKLSEFHIDASAEGRDNLHRVMGSLHRKVGDVCTMYQARMRKHAYVTPRTFLCLIEFYQKLYELKFDDVNAQEKSVNLGLLKLAEAREYVETMQGEISRQEKVVQVEEEKTNKMLVRVQSQKAKAEKKADEVRFQKRECEAKAASIQQDKEEANIELNNALPFLHDATAACNSIRDKDIVELKLQKNPTDVVRFTLDGILILRSLRILDVRPEEKLINKVTAWFIHDSFDEVARSVISDMSFVKELKHFADHERDSINAETCELLEPYLRVHLDPQKSWGPWKGHSVLDQALARKASVAAAGLCNFVGAMVMYYQASIIVKPKIQLLKVQEAKMAKAKSELEASEEEMKRVNGEVAELDANLQDAVNKKDELEANARAMKKKMGAANRLLLGLSGENERWTEDAKNFASRRHRLVGDVLLACCFITYCGPFNSEFRDKLNYETFLAEVHRKQLPASEKVNLVEFLVDEGTIGEWCLEGLPSDDLSIQNGIMATRSLRYPLMVDPQGQALHWIKTKEAARISLDPMSCVTTLQNKFLKDQIERTMTEGLCLIIENVENEIDPMFDPILEKAVEKRAGKKLVIRVGDQTIDYNPAFSLYMTSRLPNPHFSPEVCAKTTVIDFTVTLRGLEQQLLGRVLNMEQRALEETLAQLKEEATNNTKSLQLLGKQLLDRLSNASGNLLDDTDLIEVLANTKAKAKEVEGKLVEARERTEEIDEKREQFRPVATRGSIMYFNMTDMTLVINPITLQLSGWMYNCSLVQFLEQFDHSVRNSEKSQAASKRVEKIIEHLTYQVYRYVNRGLFERDKMMFKLMVALKNMVVAGELTNGDVSVFLKAGSSVDKNVERPCPFRWMQDRAWLNAMELTRHAFGPNSLCVFRDLAEVMQRNESPWRNWFLENEPENCPVPDFEEQIGLDRNKNIGPFLRLVLVRSLREDRTSIASSQFIEHQLGSRFTAPVTDSISEIFQESEARKPVLYLLSAGTDPTSAIDELAKRRKKFPTDKVSMGEGQERVAREKNQAAFITGGWVILQNCHLGIDYMGEMEETLTKTLEIDDDYRLWITCEITKRFPIGLLQMAIKVSLEPPAGLKAQMHRAYTTMISQETIDKVDHDKWRSLLYGMSFLHSIVQERRKFGPIGWCVPYEFNNSDLDASLLFLEKHLSTTILVGQALSWTTIQYMVAEVQYGGRITDDLDRELFATYASKWLCDDVFKQSFSFNHHSADNSSYKIPEGLDIGIYQTSIDTIPPVDSPNIFGLHVNADLTYRLKEASEMLATIVETQPKESGSAEGKSVDDIVKEQVGELLERMPCDFVEEAYRTMISKLKGPPKLDEKGFLAPLNTFLFQELQRLQNIVAIVRSNLRNLSMAIDGTVVMTTDLLEDLNSVFDGRVPRKWTHDPSNAEISWLLPNIGGWFTGLLDRHAQLSTWLEHGRREMKSFWISGFTNPHGFLTGIRQEVTRQHKKDQWALDEVVTHTEVQTVDPERVRDVWEEGQNIHGLFIEGAKWNRQESKLDESEAKKLFVPMPVVYITAMMARDLKAMGNVYGPYGPYNAAVYKYPQRNDRYIILRLNLKTTDHHPHHWRLRGVCLVAQME